MLELRNIRKVFDHEAVVRDVSLVVPQGELLSILGPSGCGKTTLLRILAGFESPDSGSVLFDGRDITAVAANHRPFNMVFQKYALFPHLSVEDNVAFGPRIRGETGAKLAQKVKDALELVRLDGFATRGISTLSGGQQQRVALARAIINNPKILLLDEPMSALDRNLREKMRLDIIQIQRKLGITFIMVTHDQEEAMAMSDRIAIMNQGGIEQVGTPEVIYRVPNSAFVAQSMGALNKLTVGGQAVFIRPEHIKVLKREKSASALTGTKLPAVVREILFKGPVVHYVMELLDHGDTGQVTAVTFAEAFQDTVVSVDDFVEITWDKAFEVPIEPMRHNS
jgi:spermidine/putrescine transport system ATP-binding protein